MQEDQGGNIHRELRGARESQYIPGRREPGAARKDRENIRGTCCALGWLGGSLAEAQRGPEMPREAERGPERAREPQRGPGQKVASFFGPFVAIWGPSKKRLPKM